MTLDDIKEEILKAKSIVILTHESPDGDAIGSSMAVYLALKSIGKEPDVIIPEMPRVFEFLPNINEVKKSSNVEKYDLAIALDCADIKRLNGFSQYFENAKSTIVIDHHSGNTMFGQYNYVNPVSPACAQILCVIFEYFGIEITNEIGECLITGIITDTGGFKYSNVTSDTFDFAAGLLEKGVNISNIYERVMQTVTISRFNLTRIAVDRLELLEDGKIAFTYITMEDERKVNADYGDHEGIVEQGRSIEGVLVSVFLRETEQGYRVSLRANNNSNINVADICMIFGGGGHIRAAGCLLQGTLAAAKEKIIDEIKRSINNYEK